MHGELADIRSLRTLASTRGLVVVEDACQAHGGSRDGLRPGEVSDAAAFSFYPSKNLGAFGDAGAVVTSNLGVARRVMALRDHGQVAKHVHECVGVPRVSTQSRHSFSGIS